MNPSRWESQISGPFAWPTTRAAEWTQALTKSTNVDAVVAIGSAARGRATPRSDVDLIVVCEEIRNKVAAPPEVDARWVTAANLPVVAARGDDVVAWGVAFGVALYDRRGTWAQLVRQWRHRVPMPSADVCRQRAARARRYAAELLDIGDEEAATEQATTMLTHLARWALCAHRIFPASRPELPAQLEAVGEAELAALLSRAVFGTLAPRDALAFAETRSGQEPSPGSRRRPETALVPGGAGPTRPR